MRVTGASQVVSGTDDDYPLSGGSRGAALRLLIVDDDAVDRMAVRRAIGRSNLGATEVTDAPDAATALDLLDTTGRPFDCVLLDYDLSGDTGLDVLRQLREAGRLMPVVMLTGQADPLAAAAAMKAGATEFLTKDLLLETVRQYALEHPALWAAASRTPRGHRAFGATLP